MKNYWKKIVQQPIRWAFYFVLMAVLVTNLLIHPWNRGDRVIASDVKGYYAYLPATFIYHDLRFIFLNDTSNPYREIQKNDIWYNLSADGTPIIQYTSGMAILYSPFFFAAHLGAKITGVPAHGYSMPYDIMLQVGAILYFIMGLWFLRRVLSLYFSEKTTAITLIAVTLGTNLLYYASKEAAMSHLFSFSFIALFIWLLLRWLDRPSWQNTIQLGLTTGIIILIRPSNVIIIALFGLMNITRWSDLRERVLFLFKKYRQVLIMILAAFIVWIPQFLYWHAVTGQVFYNSYGGDVGFFWTDPEIFNILFSYRKGWLLYTPMMILALIGLIPLYKKNRGLFWSSLFITIATIYIFSSWCFWWFGGSFGSRPFIDYYAIFAIPMAACIEYIMKLRKKIWHRAILVLVSILLLFNIFQIIQYRRALIHYVSMTKEAYWGVFLKLKHPPKYESMLEYPDYEGVISRVKEKKEKKSR
ncbi:MAG: hypothetical protein EOL88_11050 [Bacteroidia bacterium]|nr:hypothetical protein [Bacteroidia bacterium]